MTPEINIRTPNLPNTNNLINHANTEPTAIKWTNFTKEITENKTKFSLPELYKFR